MHDGGNGGQCGISAAELLTPTCNCVDDVLSIIDQHEVHGIAHITGGGLVENIERILPKGLGLDIDYSAIQTPDIFIKLQQAGQLQILKCGVYLIWGWGWL